MLHVPAPPTPNKHADPAVQQALLRQLSPPQQQLQQQVLGLSLDNSSSSSLFRGYSDVIDTATLLMPMQLRDTGNRCSFEYSISDPGDASCSTSTSNSSNVLPVLDLPPGLACPFPANNSTSSNSPGSRPVAYIADSAAPMPPLFMQGSIGGCMPAQQQQQQLLPVAGVSGNMYQPQQQQLQLTNIDPAALSAMLQRMSVTSPDMQQLQLQVPVSQPAQPAIGSPAHLLLQQQQQALIMPQQQQELLQLVSAPPAALAASSSMLAAAATGVRPQLLLPVAAGAGSGLVHVASPSGLHPQHQQQLQLPVTGGIDVSAFGGQQYALQQLPW
jgi:hypothetical protein